jgi:hypothetical protein
MTKNLYPVTATILSFGGCLETIATLWARFVTIQRASAAAPRRAATVSQQMF